ncbi:class I SAM-dependent methyltransferase [Candidatus Woesearchaeota archaeon]|nr:class I SAM-dependent methyltransferase [Candidatus Woesearchaeota archaeon]
MLTKVRKYWNKSLHDAKVAKRPISTKGFFDDLADYHFGKLGYMRKFADFGSYKGKKVLEIGCGMGVDLLRFAENGAIVTGIDIADRPLEMAKRNFSLHRQKGAFMAMNGEDLKFKDNSFDAVFMQGVLQYTPNPSRMVSGAHRVLKKGGILLLTVYNKYSWLNLVSKASGVALEHSDAPVYRKFTFNEVKELLKNFSQVELKGERFPVATKLHSGIKADIYNSIFIRVFSLIPKKMVSPFGWHITARAIK